MLPLCKRLWKVIALLCSHSNGFNSKLSPCQIVTVAEVLVYMNDCVTMFHEPIKSSLEVWCSFWITALIYIFILSASINSTMNIYIYPKTHTIKSSITMLTIKYAHHQTLHYHEKSTYHMHNVYSPDGFSHVFMHSKIHT